jgi:hydrogenase/urease accessory protein HupE
MSGALGRLFVLLLAFVGVAPAAFGHEIRPGFLQIREVEPATYDILWKTPAQGQMRLALNVVLPKECVNLSEPRSTLVDAAVIQRWRTACDGGLVGKRLAVENLDATLTDTILRFEPLDGSPKTLRVTADQPSVTIPDRQPWMKVAVTYFGLGVEHILLGFDHLMFVAALLILVADTRRLVGAVTAFTAAHCLTLAGTTLGWIKLPSAPVEALIALSIVFLAVEIVRVRSGADSVTARLPWLASFGFGLLHGFGFAGALRQIGIPDDALAVALLFFNAGVEVGQLLFIAAILIGMWLWQRAPWRAPLQAWRAPVYVIGGVSAFWVVERTAGLLGL